MYRLTLDQTPTFAVLLLHGLYAKADELKPIATKLKEAFGRSALIIQPTCRVRLKSVTRSLDQQAENLLKEVQAVYIHYKKELKSFPIIIIGYSQGGVLACTLGKSYRDKLNIVGIITLNAPLKGTPLLERNRRDLQEFISHSEKGLQLIDYSLSRIKQIMTLQAWMRMLIRPRWVPGLKDILPNSNLIKGISSFLQDNVEIPCLLVATYENDFSQLFNINIQTTDHHKAIKALNIAYALFITGDQNGRHDTLIPLDSQLGRAVNHSMPIDQHTKDHNFSSIIPPKATYIKRKIYKGILHARNLVAIDPSLFVEHGATVLYDALILNDLIQFIKPLV